MRTSHPADRQTTHRRIPHRPHPPIHPHTSTMPQKIRNPNRRRTRHGQTMESRNHPTPMDHRQRGITRPHSAQALRVRPVSRMGANGHHKHIRTAHHHGRCHRPITCRRHHRRNPRPRNPYTCQRIEHHRPIKRRTRRAVTARAAQHGIQPHQRTIRSTYSTRRIHQTPRTIPWKKPMPESIPAYHRNRPLAARNKNQAGPDTARPTRT